MNNEDAYNAWAFDICSEVYHHMKMDPWAGSPVEKLARALTTIPNEKEILKMEKPTTADEVPGSDLEEMQINTEIYEEPTEELYVIEDSGRSTSQPQGRRAAIEHTKRKLANE